MFKTHYEILGVSQEATPDEIKTAYRKNSHNRHPDTYSGKDEELKAIFEQKFRELKKAYDVLSNPAKRMEYDWEISRKDFNHYERCDEHVRQKKEQEKQEQEQSEQENQSDDLNNKDSNTDQVPWYDNPMTAVIISLTPILIFFLVVFVYFVLEFFGVII